ncbi:MAG: hypothetical protein LC800_19640, partial [Acidobacteria bacterium]|nr:hypothetical protein [Acidobacteriota bacterium]
MTRLTNSRRRTAAHFCVSALLITFWVFAAVAQRRVPVPDRIDTIPQRTTPTWNFETGDLRGWTATGTAFDSQPTFGNNVASRRPGLVINQQGNYWIGTYENRPSSAMPVGTAQGDAPTGTLTSE